jgi:endonuclease/exonuclease/phosphatase family metal-dependent hydrolase
VQQKIIHAFLSFCLLVVLSTASAAPTNTFIVAAYNIENWNSIERRGQPNQPKPKREKDAVISIIATVRPDVLGLEEMGQTNDLTELAAGVREKGVDYPYQEWVQSTDTDRHVALLSRFPIVQRFSRTDYTYQLEGKPMRVQRGFLDVLIKVADHYSFRAIVAHLKSKRQTDIGNQETMRLEEARLLRAHIGKALKDDPKSNLVAMGDFNDTPDSAPIRALLGEPPFTLFDLRPVDSAGRDGTHLWRARQEYSRIDYLILSPGMSNDFVAGSARIADLPEWSTASDHRMVYASFRAQDDTVHAATTHVAGGRPPLGWIILGVVLIVGIGVVMIRVSHRPSLPAT